MTRDCQLLPSLKKLRTQKDGSLDKAETSHTSHTPIPLFTHTPKERERERERIISSSYRLVFGATQLWVFQNPNDNRSSKINNQEITFEYAQEEIAAKSGVDMSSKGDAGELTGRVT